MAAHVRITCSKCGRSGLKIRTEYLGHSVKCKHCGLEFLAGEEHTGASPPSERPEGVASAEVETLREALNLSEASLAAAREQVRSDAAARVEAEKALSAELKRLEAESAAGREQGARLARDLDRTAAALKDALDAATLAARERDSVAQERDSAFGERTRLEAEAASLRDQLADARRLGADQARASASASAAERSADALRREVQALETQAASLRDELTDARRLADERAHEAERAATALRSEVEARAAELPEQLARLSETHDAELSRLTGEAERSADALRRDVQALEAESASLRDELATALRLAEDQSGAPASTASVAASEQVVEAERAADALRCEVQTLQAEALSLREQLTAARRLTDEHARAAAEASERAVEAERSAEALRREVEAKAAELPEHLGRLSRTHASERSRLADEADLVRSELAETRRHLDAAVLRSEEAARLGEELRSALDRAESERQDERAQNEQRLVALRKDLDGERTRAQGERQRADALGATVAGLERRLADAISALESARELADAAEADLKALRERDARPAGVTPASDDSEPNRLDELARELQAARLSNQRLGALLGVFGMPRIEVAPSPPALLRTAEPAAQD